MMFLFFSFPQGLPGFVGPPGQMGIAGEKVKNVFNLQLLQGSQLAAAVLRLL